jgi:hypothetical protein
VVGRIASYSSISLLTVLFRFGSFCFGLGPRNGQRGAPFGLRLDGALRGTAISPRGGGGVGLREHANGRPRSPDTGIGQLEWGAPSPLSMRGTNPVGVGGDTIATVTSRSIGLAAAHTRSMPTMFLHSLRPAASTDAAAATRVASG